MINEFNNVMRERELEFFLSMKSPPTATHQMKQINFKEKRVYEPYAVKKARADLEGALSGFIPQEPFLGALRLTTKWCYPSGEHNAPSYKTTKPDTDNMIKLLKDCMTKLGFWKDDAQVASEITEKFWATPTGIYIKVESL